MKTYAVEVKWHFKGRYLRSERHRVEASNVRAGIGKALAGRRPGWRERDGAVLFVTATVINVPDGHRMDTGGNEEGSHGEDS